jgi:sec-independent protein translocase protein TatC
VFLGAFVVGMLLTPPDVFSQTLLAIPMYLLYEGGIVMARLLSQPAAAEKSVRDKPA